MEKRRADDLKVVVKMDKQYDLDMAKDLGIDKASINADLANQPAMFAWYATLSELAKDKVAKAKSHLEVTEAELDQRIRRDWDIDRNGKMTEAGVSASIKLSPIYQKAESQLQEAQKTNGLLNVARQAFDQRKDMLISLAANMRAESDTEITVLKEKVAKTMRNARQ
jgi:hypothetical protein